MKESLRQECFRRHGKRCLKCGATHGVEVDHIYPQADYPEKADDPNNLQPLCGPCNKAKGRKIEDYRVGKINRLIVWLLRLFVVSLLVFLASTGPEDYWPLITKYTGLTTVERCEASVNPQ